jgi:hypothetical protein
VPGRVGALLFPLYIVAWAGYVQAGGAEFCLFLVVFLPGVSPASQQDFYFKEHMLATSSL